jgi:hypothetical protein
MLSREVSMSKGFKKPRTAAAPAPTVTKNPPPQAPTVEGINVNESGGGKILVENTPVKDKAVARRASLTRFGSHYRMDPMVVKMEVDGDGGMEQQSAEPVGVFANSTPVKGGKAFGLPLTGDSEDDGETDDEEGEEEWVISSPSFRALSVKALSSSDPEDPSSPDELSGLFGR